MLLVAALLHALMARRTSAATRHLLGAITIAGLLLLPVLPAALPPWTAVTMTAVPLEVAPATASTDSMRSLATNSASESADAAVDVSPPPLPPSSPRVSWPIVLVALYIGGVVVLALRLVGERFATGRLARAATTITEPEWTELLAECATIFGVRRGVRLQRNGLPSMPMAFGIRSAVILLPSDADEWSADRRRTVLLHDWRTSRGSTA